ncbi:hypothetical protein JXA85_01815 [Candidatus Woesearchaeota archaeon]|nr:hypothetical protein [Candidatus Woesearchaeota archaeon]
MEIKKEYLELSRKHKLPDYDTLNNEFEICLIEHPDFLLREIRRKIAEKMDYYARLVEELLSAEPTLNSLHECKNLSEDKKKKAYDVHRMLMFLIRNSAEISLINSDEENSAFIKNSLAQWINLKPGLKDVISMMKDSWKEELGEKEEPGYFG